MEQTEPIEKTCSGFFSLGIPLGLVYPIGSLCCPWRRYQLILSSQLWTNLNPNSCRMVSFWLPCSIKGAGMLRFFDTHLRVVWKWWCKNTWLRDFALVACSLLLSLFSKKYCGGKTVATLKSDISDSKLGQSRATLATRCHGTALLIVCYKSEKSIFCVLDFHN